MILWLTLACAPGPASSTAWERDRVELDVAVEAAEAWAARDLRAWTRSEAVATALAARARHTGRLDDFEAADHALALAFDAAREGSGPWLAQAELDLSLHRFDAAEQAARRALDATVVGDPDRSRAYRVLGRVALERDELGKAATALGQAHALAPTPRTWADLAILAGRRSDPTAAELAWTEARAACACPGERFDGWVALQRGLVLLDEDQPALALPWFQEADRRYDGDWVFREHLAEAYAATGQLEQADATYALAVGAARDPEVLGAWAGVKRELGQPELASALVDEAREGFEGALARFPEAAAGHAVDFFAEHGPVERALEAARADARARPTPDRLARLEALEAL